MIEPFTNYLGIDIGFNTIDVFQVVDGTVVGTDVKGYVNYGVCKIAGAIQEFIKQKHSIDISLPRARQAIYDKGITIRGQIIDLKVVISQAVKDYVEFLHKFLEAEFGGVMNSVSNIIIFGGGAEIIKSEQEVWNSFYNKNFVRFPEKFSEYYNALGCLYV